MANWFEQLESDLGSHVAVRRCGSGWFSGFFGLLMAITGLCLVVALRWPDWFATPELAPVYQWAGLRPAIHLILPKIVAIDEDDDGEMQVLAH